MCLLGFHMSIKDIILFDHYHLMLRDVKLEIEDEEAEGKTGEEVKIKIAEFLKTCYLPMIELLSDREHIVGCIGEGNNVYGQYRKSVQVLVFIVPDPKIKEYWDLRASTWDGYSSRINWNYKCIEIYIDIEGFNDFGDQINLSEEEAANNIESQVKHLIQWVGKHNTIITQKNKWLHNEVEKFFKTKERTLIDIQKKDEGLIKKIMKKWCNF